MPTHSLAALLGLFAFGPATLLSGQSPQQPAPSSDASTITLHAESRIVLTDITVTDRNGNPVHNLPASAFRVFDNNQPQTIASFDEHTTASTVTKLPPATTNGSYSNAFFQHLPPVLNIVVLDTTNLELPDQMFLRQQLDRFIDTLPAGQPIAIFERRGDNAILLQNFTADHALLLAAAHRAVPHILLTGREYRSDTDTLHQIGAWLSQVPGRKNLLWFSGGSTSYLLAGLADINMTGAGGASGTQAPAPAVPAFSGSITGGDIDALRQVYDELEAARISVYPIDARGLTTGFDLAMRGQQAQMNDVAEATGGEAFFNQNGLAQIASRILSTDSSAYTLTYSPRNFHYDHKWHAVRITLKGGYHLSYRRGYFADPPHALVVNHDTHPNPLFSARTHAAIPPDVRSSPILFQASVHPAANAPPPADGFIPLRAAAPPKKGTESFAIDYSLSTSALTPVPIDGAPQATLAFAVVAFDSDGNRVGQALDRVRFALKPDAPPKTLRVQQQIDLRKGEAYLALVVWDAGSGRLGTLQIPVQVNSPARSN